MSEPVCDFLIPGIREWSIRRIYGYPGDGINGIIGAIDRANGEIEYIQVRQESPRFSPSRMRIASVIRA